MAPIPYPDYIERPLPSAPCAPTTFIPMEPAHEDALGTLLGRLLGDEPAPGPPYTHIFKPPEPDGYDADGRPYFRPKPMFTLTRLPPAGLSRESVDAVMRSWRAAGWVHHAPDTWCRGTPSATLATITAGGRGGGKTAAAQRFHDIMHDPTTSPGWYAEDIQRLAAGILALVEPPVGGAGDV